MVVDNRKWLHIQQFQEGLEKYVKYGTPISSIFSSLRIDFSRCNSDAECIVLLCQQCYIAKFEVFIYGNNKIESITNSIKYEISLTVREGAMVLAHIEDNIIKTIKTNN